MKQCSEQTALIHLHPGAIKDDIFLLLSDIEHTLQNLNSNYKTIKCTNEIESNGSLPFPF